MDSTSSAGWWAFGILAVIVILLAIWWATTLSGTSPGVPNTGATTTMSQSGSTMY